MSVVIIGGHDRMVCQYKEICKNYKCKAKVFTHLPSNFKSKIGNPDLLVLFTSTVSHSMVSGALQEANKNNIAIARSHSSSCCALKKILDCHCC
ncbi:DUF2325 domain-containing protein [Clostridium sp. MD294]|uniref:DUF2325 domain-containing protein n=1 Tax=Clostridium sp. MD294 TaxID=97138 RepID=UPI0002CB0C2C|nr:DUF2325 domain-containing protein [Clostridium sp. MD294]NDO47181.1 DUF2325 domain-containing protein [Clostridium sp. MD294]USF29756.1 hypothetical protein C820_001164 [Clostridium sp. MD294]